jgi:hypothetical protein
MSASNEESEEETVEKHFHERSLNCRSLGFARDDKGKSDGCMESGCLGLANTLDGTVVLLCHPERSRGICSSATFRGNVFRQFLTQTFHGQ